MAKKVTPETAIKNEIKEYLKLKGWFVFPVLQGLGAFPGVSDLLAIREGTVLFLEIKAPKGRQSDKQKLFELNVKAKGGHYLIARGYEDVSKYIKERGLP